MKLSLDAIFNVDRRIVFIFVFLSILIPLLFPFAMPIKPTAAVRAVYDSLEEAMARKDRNVILLCFDFDPQTKAELEPPARAMLRHIFARGGKVLILTRVPTGVGMHEQIIRDCAQEYGAVYGKDYAYLGYRTGWPLLIVNMGQDFASAYSTDARKNSVREMEVSRHVLTLRDIGYMVEFTGLVGVLEAWITYAQGPFDLKMGAVVTGVAAPDQYNFIDSGQLTGMLGGLVGAAQYEQMLKDNGVYLSRRFAPPDLASLKMPRFCRQLAARATPLTQRVWSRLNAAQQAAVKSTADQNHDQLSDADRNAIAAALNAEIAPPAASQPDATQPAAVGISDADLADIERTLPAAIASLLKTRPDVAARREQVLRRLFIEQEFGSALAKAQTDGQAVRWMTPQSIAHLVLIAAILFGNVCYLIERNRRRKAEASKA